MRSLLLIVASFAITIFCWGVYGPVLHWGQHGMATPPEHLARLRPFVCVGLAYFAIGVVVPLILLSLYGEDGKWTTRGALFSLFAGALGALGALGIILAFHFGGKPVYVMPLVFGGAPIVNSFLTIFLARKMKEIGPLFFTGLIMVILGSVTVLMNQPTEETTAPANPAAATAATDAAVQPEPGFLERLGTNLLDFTWQMLAVALVVGSWGAYGPMLHKGQAAMDNSRLRPLLCVGLAYFLIAVLVPNALLQVIPEASSFRNVSGTLWSLAAGAAGAVGALGIIMAFNFGGKPIYVMPLIFGGAPVVSTLFSSATNRTLGQLDPMFLAGLILVVAGAVMVLVFAPRSGHASTHEPVVEKNPEPKIEEKPAFLPDEKHSSSADTP
ncbi:MAG: hypothetical protein WD851_03080 [Pirellulales bacterium]